MTRALSRDEVRALDALDEAATVRLLLDLLAVASVTGADAESSLQHRLADQLRRLDLDVDLWDMDLPALRADGGFPGSEAPRTEAWGLVANTGAAGEGPTVILQGHVDVVPPGDLGQWAGDPFVPRIANGCVHARGACDMKGGIASILAAVAAIRASKARLRGRLSVHFVASEEDGGLGAFGTLQRGHTGDACIIAEPTSGRLVTANAGALTFRVEVPGRATHGSTRYAGVSAIDAFLPIHRALSRLETARNTEPHHLMTEWPIPYPLSIGTIRAGDWASSVPDLLVAEGRLGVRLDEDPAQARHELEACIDEACSADPWLREHPARVSWPGGQFASGRLPDDHPLIGLVRGAHADATGDPTPLSARGAPYGSDLRLYQSAGVPTLQYGPGDVRLAHGPQEQVPLAEVFAVARGLILTTLRAVATP